YEDHAFADVRQVHRLPLPLVEERGEILLAHEGGELVVGGEIGCSERGEGGGIEPGVFADAEDELAVPVDEEHAASSRSRVERLQDGAHAPGVVLQNRPGGGPLVHPAISDEAARAASPSSMRTRMALARLRMSGRDSEAMKSRSRRTRSTDGGRLPR